MGSRASQTLKEIEDLRTGLDEKLDELENRVPAVAKVGKKAIGMLLGGGAGGSVLWMAISRRRTKKKVKEVKEERAPAPAPVIVNVLPPQAIPVAAAAVAVWAGIKLLEARGKAKRQEAKSPRLVRTSKPGSSAAS